MAEDIHNPLNTPDAEPAAESAPAPTSEPEPVNEELSEFLDDLFESEPGLEALADEPTTTDLAPEREPATESAPLPDAAPVADSPEEGVVTPPPPDGLQRETLEKINAHLDRMADPPPEPQAEPESLTPDQFIQQYQAAVQQAIDTGWMDADFAALYPAEAAWRVHTHLAGGQLQQSVQQAQQFTQAEEERRFRAEVEAEIQSGFDGVMAMGDQYSALSDKDVRAGFRDFIIETDLKRAQLTPEILARQFYAYRHELIIDTVRAAQGTTGAASGNSAPTQSEPSAARLAQQEGSSARTESSVPEKPEFADLLEGTAAARWFE